MPANEEKLKPGNVLRYKPLGGFEPYHCHEGLAIVTDEGAALDTFWNCGEKSRLTGAELANAEVVFNLDDFEAIGRYDQHKWESFHPDDRQIITAQHGHITTLYVRKGATPDLDTQIANAEAAVAAAEYELRSAESALASRRRELDALRTPAPSPSTAQKG